MATLKGKIESELSLSAKNETLCIPSTHTHAGASDAFMQSCLSRNFKFLKTNVGRDVDSHEGRIPPSLQFYDDRVAQGLLNVHQNGNPKVVSRNEVMDYLEVEDHEVKFSHCCSIPASESRDALDSA